MLRPVLVGLLVLAPALAADDDPIKADLDKVRTVHAEKVAAARTTFLAAFDAKLKEVAGKDDLDGAKAVKREKEAFEKDGKLPAAAPLTRDKKDYQDAVKAADDLLRKALEKAKTGYTKALKLEEAEAIAKELAVPQSKPLAKAGGAAKKVDDGRTKFVCSNGVVLSQSAGTKKWKEVLADGSALEFEEVSRNTEYVELIDNSRDGIRFRIYATHTYVHNPQLRMPAGWWHEHHTGKWSK